MGAFLWVEFGFWYMLRWILNLIDEMTVNAILVYQNLVYDK